MKKKCLVTGATGFIGSHVVETLVGAGFDVRATDIAPAWGRDDPKRGRFPETSRRLGACVEIVPADVTDAASLVGLADGVDYVFHVAAIFSYSVPRDTLFKVNVDGTRNLLEEISRARGVKRLIAWGAGGVYGFVDGPLEEDREPAPPNDYLCSKTAQENLVREECKKRGISFAIIRPTTVYGPRGVYGGGQLLMDTARQPILMAPVNFDMKIPFIHVEDVARSALHLALSPDADGKTFNLNDDTRMSFIEFSRYLARLLGKPFLPLPPIPVESLREGLKSVARIGKKLGDRFGFSSPLEEDSMDYLGRSFHFVNHRLKETGFRFRYPDAREGIRDTISWYKKEGWLS